jgi:DNA polymerase (family 10)
LIDLKGFGEKTQEKIRKTLEFYFQNKHKVHYPTAFEYAQEVIRFLKTKYNIQNIEITGKIRRKCETVEKIELLVCSEQETVIENIDFSPIPVDIHYCTPEQKAFHLLLTTGHPKHVQKLQLKGLEFAKSEPEIYAKNNLPYIPPELREDFIEWKLAENKNNIRLIETKDIKGLVHCHTVWSDGANTIEEMALSARDKGLEYVVITDHSKSAFYANGLSEERILQQQEEIAALNRKSLGIKIFSGIEADILPDGSLDYADNILQSFDLVIASVHSVLNMDKAKATERILKAIENPFVHMIGHISGRLLLSRAGYEPDYDKIFDACVQNKVIIEINANPMRLDIDWKHAAKAKEKGVKFSINPDAHNLNGIAHIQYGVNVARKAGLEPKDVVNSCSADDFFNIIRK